MKPQSDSSAISTPFLSSLFGLPEDSFRFFHRLLPHLDACDVAPLFQMTLLGLQRWATDPEVARVGLDLLTDLSRLPSSFPLFHSQFQAVWTDPHLPLTVITGFCRGLRLSSTYHPSGAAELAALAQPLRKAVLRQVEEWDPQAVGGPQLPLTARRFAALAALATVHPVEDQRLLEALETKLSDEFPEHLLPCAAPLLASLAQQGHSQLPTRVCTAMAQLPASLGLQEGTAHVHEPCTDEWEPRAFELLCSAEQLSPLAFHRLLSGLSHPDERLQTKAIQRLHALEWWRSGRQAGPMPRLKRWHEKRGQLCRDVAWRAPVRVVLRAPLPRGPWRIGWRDFDRPGGKKLQLPQLLLRVQHRWRRTRGLVGPHASLDQLEHQLRRFSNDPRKAANGYFRSACAEKIPFDFEPRPLRVSSSSTTSALSTSLLTASQELHQRIIQDEDFWTKAFQSIFQEVPRPVCEDGGAETAFRWFAERWRLELEKVCPKCAARRAIIPIVYGFPSAPLTAQYRKGSLVLTEVCGFLGPCWACRRCHFEFEQYPYSSSSERTLGTSMVRKYPFLRVCLAADGATDDAESGLSCPRCQRALCSVMGGASDGELRSSSCGTAPTAPTGGRQGRDLCTGSGSSGAPMDLGREVLEALRHNARLLQEKSSQNARFCTPNRRTLQNPTDPPATPVTTSWTTSAGDLLARAQRDRRATEATRCHGAMSLISHSSEVEGAIHIVTLNRPDAQNALTMDMMNDIATLFRELREDKKVRAVILTGAGKKAFSAGVDLLKADGIFTGYFPTPVEKDPRETFPWPVICAVNGFAITGGFELALACDMLIASENASFADTHSKFGIAPAWGLSQKLSRIMGPGRAKELHFTGRFLKAKEPKTV
eukprot:g33183.t1